ncbi:hypothetical protein HDA32_001257 [Spinactinospora alkalitolerans]|uniref:Ferritin-like domain-containing protein n=1 Tax=Spinactinospora alkalitolerans TaxID=687207 RepID=A0A852TS76_9ACTN|nr:hypothetical protein [Spinactinospora alkalitolerans]NYE46137.1 hypothetical protein [Spinactinospora alkalitolerans]
MRHDPVSRRTVIAGAIAGLAAVGLSGCQGARWYPSEISPDEYLLRGAIAEKERIVARYRATISAGRGPVELLERLVGDHERHLGALRDRLPEREEEPRGGATGAPEAGGAPETAPEPDAPVPVPALRVAEEAAAASRARQMTEVADSGLAQLFASVGACEAGHAHLLSTETPEA